MRGQSSRAPAGLSGRCELVVGPLSRRPFATAALGVEQVRLDVVDERVLVAAPHDRGAFAANRLHDTRQAAHLPGCLTLPRKHEYEVAAAKLAHPLLMLCTTRLGAIPRRGEDPSNGRRAVCRRVK